MSRQPKPDPGLPTPPAHLTAAASSSSTSNSPLPTSTNYTDFILRSSASSSSSGVKHNVMKFNALGSRSIDPANDELFTRPVKLNRKDPRTVRRLTDADRERHNKRAFVKAAKKAGRGDGMDLDDVKEEGEDGVKGEVKDEDGAGEDGKETKETLDAALVGKGANGAGLPNRRGPGGQFKKKTKRVYVSSEEARRLKREEWQPWVLEDDEGKERWIGRLEGGAGEVEGAPPGSSAAKKEAEEKKKAGLQGWRPAAQATSEAGGGGSSYVAFVFGDNGDEFKVVPISRWYRFNQGPKYLTLAEEEAEVEYERQQKSKEPERWIMHRRAAPAPSSGSSTPVPSSSTGANTNDGVSASALRSRMMANSSLGTGTSREGNAGPSKIRAVMKAGEQVGGKSKKGRFGHGQEGDDDEFDYEEDFQDDEEGIAKIDDLADEEETKELEERIRREMRAAERPDEVPDAPEGADDEREIARLTGTGREVKKLMKKNDKSGAYESDDEDENPYGSADESDSDAASATSAGAARPSSRAGSRAASPSAPSSSHLHRSDSLPRSRAGTPTNAGSAYLAKRATSPHGSRDASPGASSKRKRDSMTPGGGVDGGYDSDGKRRKSGKGKSPSPSVPTALLTQGDLVAFFKTRPNSSAATKDVLTHFRKQIKGNEENKGLIGGLLQAVANLEAGVLVLKAGL